MTGELTQEKRILNLLHAAWPNWTPATAMSHVSLQYGRVVHGLRRKGWQIANRVEIQPDGSKHGSFRLGEPLTSRTPTPMGKPPKSAASGALFTAQELEACAPEPEYPN